MAYRVNVTAEGGFQVEAETAADVRALFGELGVPLFPPAGQRRLLAAGAGADIVVEPHELEPLPRRRGGRRRKVARPRAAHQARSPRRPVAPPRETARPSRRVEAPPALDVEARILQALASGPLKPRELWDRTGLDRLKARSAVRALVADGRVRTAGRTVSRVLMLGSAKARSRESAAPAKEAPTGGGRGGAGAP